jgi:hypothetical protein
MSYTCLDRQPRLEREIPLRIFNLCHRSENQRLSFNESLWTRGPAAVDLVYGPWTYSIDFSIENNSLILKIHQPC